MFPLYPNSPTLDIYFQVPLRHLISRLPGPTPGRPIRRFGPNTFICKDSAVIIRYATRKELGRLANRSLKRIYYLIDDDLFDLADDTSLPADYRAKLRRFANGILPRILEVSDTIVSPSSRILEKFEDKQCELLAPACLSVCEDFSHFDSPGMMRAIFPGTRSHIADLRAIAPAVMTALRVHGTLSITTYLGEHGARALGRHRRIAHRLPQSWEHYRKTMVEERFHLALVPYRDTEFNRARSINKIHDVSAFGAAGLYSDRPPSSDAIQHNENGLLLGDESEDWTDAIGHLIVNRSEAQRLAVANAATSSEIGDPSQVREFWLDRLLPGRARRNK